MRGKKGWRFLPNRLFGSKGDEHKTVPVALV
jgi:hypothetical protein